MARKSVFVTRHNFPSILYELLQEKFEVVCWRSEAQLSKNEFKEQIKGKFAVVCCAQDTLDKEVIEAAGSELKVVSTLSVGLDHLDLDELKSKRKIRIGYTPNVSAPAVAEHAIALLLATGRRVVELHNAVLKREWKSDNVLKTSRLGIGLHKSTAAVIGTGPIGLCSLKMLKGFDPKNILYYARSRKAEADELGAQLQSLDFIMKESDFIILALALNSETRGIINRARINSMKSNAIFVNIARGGLVDEEALIEALQNKKIFGAGLDVFVEEPLPFDSPLVKMDNVVLAPHIADRTVDGFNAVAEMTALNVLAVLNGDEMPAEVLTRRLRPKLQPQSQNSQRGKWKPDYKFPTSLMGSGLYKSTVAVIGCGRIGLSILRKLKPFDPKNILYYARDKKPEAEILGAEFQSLDFIMKESDFIIVALAQSAQTKGIINQARINSMKSNAILVNIARGGLIDENALIEALKSKKIGGAGLDVFNEEPLPLDSPLMKMDNVVLTPHIAYRTNDSLDSMAELAALNVLAVLNGDEMPAEVL
ncbi:glyoxylate reductase/hydroxypyruvate reductase-like [Planococcus citri]|uniref:glyoxylate reductase/hydroxypyruvate reductase-like n=1 Tax=Planococcus citri TaxID=170843 RepID=UPI0031F8BA9C